LFKFSDVDELMLTSCQLRRLYEKGEESVLRMNEVPRLTTRIIYFHEEARTDTSRIFGDKRYLEI
jgi:hypothetical protein